MTNDAKKKLVIVVAQGNPEDGKTWSGTPKSVVNELRKNGAEVFTVNAIPNKIIKGLIAVFFGLRFGSQFFRDGYWFNFACQLKVRREVVKIEKNGKRVDCIVHMGSQSVGYLLSKWSGISTVYLDYPRALQVRYRQIKRFEDQHAIKVEKFNLNYVDRILAVGNYVKESLVDDYGYDGSRVNVVGTGYNKFLEDLVRDKPKRYDQRVILFASKIEGGWKYKGGEDLLVAFRKLLKIIPDVKLVVVGSETNKRILCGEQNVEAYGFVSTEKLAELYCNASVFCMPARSEPWGLVYIEALSTKTPVIACSKMGVTEIVENNLTGWLIKSGDVDALVGLLAKVLLEPALLSEIGEHGQLAVQRKFSWQNVATQILDIPNA